MKRNRTLYTVLSIGAIGAFFGHAAWAVMAKDTFVKLLTGSLDNVLGVTLSTGTAESVVRTIGFFDITVGVVLVALLIGNITRRGILYKLAYSNFAIALYSWAAIWGFATAASRVTAAGVVFPASWDLVERAPNFMLPAALILLVHYYRSDHRPARGGDTVETVLSARKTVDH
jgi:hypothetical protein